MKGPFAPYLHQQLFLILAILAGHNHFPGLFSLVREFFVFSYCLSELWKKNISNFLLASSVFIEVSISCVAVLILCHFFLLSAFRISSLWVSAFFDIRGWSFLWIYPVGLIIFFVSVVWYFSSWKIFKLSHQYCFCSIFSSHILRILVLVVFVCVVLVVLVCVCVWGGGFCLLYTLLYFP